MNFFEDRKKMQREIQAHLLESSGHNKNQLNELCIKKNNNLKKYHITDDFLIDSIKGKKKSLGNGSANGEAYKTCSIDKDVCISIKQVPDKNNLSTLELNSQEKSNTEEWIEMISLELCQLLVEQDICPNLPIVYNSFMCNTCDFNNKKLKTKSCFVIANELAELGDGMNFFQKYFFNIIHTSNEAYDNIIQNILFQIYVGLYSLQKYFNMTHHDLHIGNILFKKIPLDNKYIKYRIDKQDYYLPNLGFMVTLWDFGYAFIPNKLMSSHNKGYYTDLENYNINNVTRVIPDWLQIPRLSVDYNRITSQIDKILKKTIPLDSSVCETFKTDFETGLSLPSVIKKFKIFKKRQSKKDILYSCSLDKKLKTNKIKDELTEYLTLYSIGKSKVPDMNEELTYMSYYITIRNNYIRNKLKTKITYAYNPENYKFSTITLKEKKNPKISNCNCSSKTEVYNTKTKKCIDKESSKGKEIVQCKTDKLKEVMSEYKKGQLKTKDKKTVTNHRQAYAIGLVEACRKC